MRLKFLNAENRKKNRICSISSLPIKANIDNIHTLYMLLMAFYQRWDFSKCIDSTELLKYLLLEFRHIRNGVGIQSKL